VTATVGQQINLSQPLAQLIITNFGAKSDPKPTQQLSRLANTSKQIEDLKLLQRG